MEISGKDGDALFPAADNQFKVVLELHPPEVPTEAPEPAFRIVRPGGQGVDLWQPPSNGQQPPHS